MLEEVVVFRSGCGAGTVLFEECKVETLDEDGMLAVTSEVASLFIDLRA